MCIHSFDEVLIFFILFTGLCTSGKELSYGILLDTTFCLTHQCALELLSLACRYSFDGGVAMRYNLVHFILSTQQSYVAG